MMKDHECFLTKTSPSHSFAFFFVILGIIVSGFSNVFCSKEVSVDAVYKYMLKGTDRSSKVVRVDLVNLDTLDLYPISSVPIRLRYNVSRMYLPKPENPIFELQSTSGCLFRILTLMLAPFSVSTRIATEST